MSRSYKKHKIWKVGWLPKKLANRIIRHRQKQALKQGKDIPNEREIINSYDIIDYKFIATTKKEQEKHKKLWRK